MELIAIPHRSAPRRRRPILGGLVVVLLLGVAGVVLVPLALGLHHAVVRDGAMGPTWRGALTIEEVEPGRDLAVGDVVTFVAPGPGRARRSAAGREVTRRVVSIDGGVARTRADGTGVDDPWELQLDESSYARVIVRAPYAGRLLAGYRPFVLAGLLGVLVTLAVTRRGPQRPLGELEPDPDDPDDAATAGRDRRGRGFYAADVV